MFETLLETLVGLVAGLVLCVAVILQPPRAQCPGNLVLDHGVRTFGPDIGEYRCATPPPPDNPNDDFRHPPPFHPPQIVPGKIYCTGGTRPIQIDFRTVGCQRYRDPYW